MELFILGHLRTNLSVLARRARYFSTILPPWAFDSPVVPSSPFLRNIQNFYLGNPAVTFLRLAS